MKKFVTLCIFSLLFAANAFAQNTLFVKPDASSSAWAGQETVYTSLQSAIDAAVSGDQIWVAEGTYVPSVRFPNGTDDRCKSFILKAEVSLYGGFAGTETSIDDREVGDEPWDFTHATVLSGDIINTPDNNADNSYHVVYAVSASNMVFDGFTVTGGYGNRTAYNDDQKGGGIYMGGSSSSSHASQCVIRNCQLVDNLAQLQGGAAFIPYTCTMENCYVQNNMVTAANSTGGGVYFDNCTYAATVASYCVFVENTCQATSNVTASSRYGGGAVSSGNNCNFDHCMFVSNNSSNPGGAVYCGAANHFDFCYFAMNLSTKGSGIFANASSSLLTSNCLFANNQASSDGGCIYSTGSSCRSVNCTFVGNTAPANTVINGGSGYTVFNCILWNNGEDATNLMPSNVSSMYTASEGTQLSGTANLNVTAEDIAFVAPCSILGLPSTTSEADEILYADYSIYGSSVCKDAGSLATLSLAGYQFPDEDLAGEARVNGDAIDLGCFEVQCPSVQLACTSAILDTLYSDTLPGTGNIVFQFSIDDYNPEYTYTLRFNGGEEQEYEWAPEGYISQFAFPGTLTITVVRYDEESGCSDEAEIVLNYQDSIFNPHVGIAENEVPMLTVFPNPATDFCTIHHSMNSIQNARVEIFDVNGKMVASQVVESDDTIIDLSGCKSGVYFIRMTNNGKVIATSRLIKK